MTLTDTDNTGITYINKGKIVAYNAAKQFYFHSGLPVHMHHDCACVIGTTGCSHSSEAALEWEPWELDDQLPTDEGNYYLIKDLDLTKTAGKGKTYKIAKGTTVRLCMNGFSVKFDQNNKETTNYMVNAGAELLIMNCQSKLDDNGNLDEKRTVGGKFTNGLAERGGAILSYGTLKLVGVTFSENRAEPIYDGQGGGAIQVQGGKADIQHCLFTKNTTSGKGGAISISTAGHVTLSNTVMDNNQAPGGALFIYSNASTKKDGVSLTVTGNSVISNNTSTDVGGGVYIWRRDNTPEGVAPKVVFENTVFTGNQSVNTGGAIRGRGTKNGVTQIQLKECVFSENTGSQGAVMAVDYANLTGQGIVVQKNVAQKGGAVYVKYTDTHFTDSLFDDNETLTAGGGAIHTTNSSKLTLDRCTFTNNRTNKTNDGGAIRLWRSTEAVFNDCTFEGNSAGRGGAVSVLKDCKLELNGGTFTKNTAVKTGGALLALHHHQNEDIAQPEITINGTTFTYNTSKTTGGAIQIQDGILVMNSGKVSNNESPAGGGIGIEATADAKTQAIFKFNGGSVVNNHAKNGGGLMIRNNSVLYHYNGYVGYNTSEVTGGGAFLLGGATAYLYGGMYQGNFCEDCGGAINSSASKVYLYGTTITENKAEARGGGLRMYYKSYLCMEGGTISNNEAGRAGGAIAQYCDIDIKGGKITNNKVYADPKWEKHMKMGGGIAIFETSNLYRQQFHDLNISGGEISGNYCPENGGGIYMNGRHKVTITGGSIMNNEAGSMGGGIMMDNKDQFRASLTLLRIIDGEISGNRAEKGGGIYATYSAKLDIQGGTYACNTANDTGGALYLARGSISEVRNATFTGNMAEKAAAIYLLDDTVLANLKVTGNEAGDGYSVYLDQGDYDGESYVLGIIKISGDMIITDNKGNKPDMFIGKGNKINIELEGLGKNTLMNIDLEEGILTNTLIGAYNYEGGNLKYTVTYGDRSMTEFEQVQQSDPENETDATEPTKPVQSEQQVKIGIGGIAVISAVLIVAVIALLVILSVRKKKREDNAAEETVQN